MLRPFQFVLILLVFEVLGKRRRGGVVGLFIDWIWGTEEDITQTFPVMFEVNAVIKECKLCKGYRATVFKCAQDNCAFYSSENKDDSIFYEVDSNDLKIRLWFQKEQLAFNFQNALDGFWFEHPTLGSKIEVEEAVKTAKVGSSTLTRVLFKHYNTADNEDSPEVSLYHTMNVRSSHSSSLLTTSAEPQKAIQSLEDLTIFKGLKCYKMHLVSQTVKKYAKHPDNCIYGSWIFHQYFDSLNAVSNYPEIAVKYESAENPESLNLGGTWEKRTKVNVTIEFIDEDIARLISQYLKKDGTQAVPYDNLKFHSFLYAHDAVKMKYFLDCKYNETTKIWRKLLEE